ncbi:hypothetical protein KAFR_0L01090 [Kazachstania africana CBS 2517]|uniref:Aminopeptidase P N-terminal domain-containing protein n=1 Tax=Kazachstania africana (strain ATCC 22294 / BCRC 22015 / CBS 2517 / CECT 1963 / NBRC 1671 / NRRL Y-8276) TaxID=1071382 RepID=H2B267_KAZAF|nr:hypothetical protein KAFR_0L01090 [Kazachstania africana CBS 2517]CCF60717.1 hypothetical protein KAFR_0L01090 [Kazachstania africana CBS 2517]
MQATYKFTYPFLKLSPLIRRRYLSTYATQPFVQRKRSPITAGQSIHETRPFLLRPGELTIGIQSIEYNDRRRKLVSKMDNNSCIVIQSNELQFASGAVFYPFQQDNDFYYLSGWNEPNSVLIIERLSDNLDFNFTMLVPGKDKFIEQWEGNRTGEEGAMEIFNADEAFDIKHSLNSVLSDVFARNKTIYFNDKGNNSGNSQAIAKILNESSFGQNKNLKNYKKILGELRKIKSPAELKIMRAAGKISGKAYNQAFARKFRNERTLAAFLENKFLSGGCTKSAYIPVVASGSNSLCIHYTRNDDVMFDDEMVLVDASGAIGGYCSDISRTWPVNGNFTQPQKDLYQAVLNVQKQCIELCKASNNYSLDDIHQRSVSLMGQELKNLGIANLKNWDVESLYPHYIGHNLGLDVHDVPEASRFDKLQVGQVITIEPGLYIPDDDSVPAYFRNIGIRIEDDIAIGQDTYRNLTVEAVKEIIDLETIMSNGATLSKFDDDVIDPLSIE